LYGCSAVECWHPKPNAHKSKPNRRRRISIWQQQERIKKKEKPKEKPKEKQKRKKDLV